MVSSVFSFVVFFIAINNLSVNWVYNKVLDHVLKTKCFQLCCTFLCPDSDWALSSGSLDLDLFYLGNVHLVENGDLRLAESIFSLI